MPGAACNDRAPQAAPNRTTCAAGAEGCWLRMSLSVCLTREGGLRCCPCTASARSPLRSGVVSPEPRRQRDAAPGPELQTIYPDGRCEVTVLTEPMQILDRGPVADAELLPVCCPIAFRDPAPRRRCVGLRVCAPATGSQQRVDGSTGSDFTASGRGDGSGCRVEAARCLLVQGTHAPVSSGQIPPRCQAAGGPPWARRRRRHAAPLPDFISSSYCHSREMMRAMERHDVGEARVIPVILRNATCRAGTSCRRRVAGTGRG